MAGNALGWTYGPLGSIDWRDLEITMRVAQGVRPADLLINTATVASDDPADVEPEYGDNTSRLVLEAAGVRLYLPIILRR